MKLEFHAEYQMSCSTVEEVNRLAQSTAMDPHARGLLLAGLRDTRYHEFARSAWQSIGERELNKGGFDSALETMRELGVCELDDDALTAMPAGSWLLRLPFRLRKPYISRDDVEFHILDNPVRKEKVFQVPMVAASSWKGSLHAFAVRKVVPAQGSALNRDDLFTNRARLVRLFGNEEQSVAAYLNTRIAGRLYDNTEKAVEIGEAFTAWLKEKEYLKRNVEGRRGRLEFFATFFNAVGFEVINPHARDRKVGRNPILMECVPRGSIGRFELGYVPFGAERASLARQAATDFGQCAWCAFAMLTGDGFGAKTSSGFGVADHALPAPGSLQVRQRTDIAKVEITSFDVNAAVRAAGPAFAGVAP